MSLSKVADRYAQAIFDLGKESGQLTQMTREFRDFSDAFTQSASLRDTLANPLVSAAERQSVLVTLAAKLGVSQLTLNAVRVVALRHRLGAIEDIARRLEQLADTEAGIVRATVTSATTLTPDFLAQLTRALESSTGKKVLVDSHVDSSLIAGITTRIGDNTIDGSLKGHLSDLQKKLLQAS